MPSMDRHMGRSRAHSRVGETRSTWACEGGSFLRSLPEPLIRPSHKAEFPTEVKEPTYRRLVGLHHRVLLTLVQLGMSTWYMAIMKVKLKRSHSRKLATERGSTGQAFNSLPQQALPISLCVSDTVFWSLHKFSPQPSHAHMPLVSVVSNLALPLLTFGIFQHCHVEQEDE